MVDSFQSGQELAAAPRAYGNELLVPYKT